MTRARHQSSWDKIRSSGIAALLPEICADAKIETARIAYASKAKIRPLPWMRQFLFTPSGIQNMIKIELCHSAYSVVGRAGMLLANDHFHSQYERVTQMPMRSAPVFWHMSCAAASSSIATVCMTPLQLLVFSMQIRASEGFKATWQESASKIIKDKRLPQILQANTATALGRNVPIATMLFGANAFLTSTLEMSKGPYVNLAMIPFVLSMSTALYPLDLAHTHMNMAMQYHQPMIFSQICRKSFKGLYQGSCSEIVSRHINHGLLYRLGSRSVIFPLILSAKEIADGNMNKSMTEVLCDGAIGGLCSAIIGGGLQEFFTSNQ